MSGIFNKAIRLFVNTGENKATNALPANTRPKAMSQGHTSVGIALRAEDIDKFDKYFEQIFDQAGIAGPNYYEFWKMTEVLAVHVRDERSRIAATFASLSIQGLTRERLVETAQQYKKLVIDDRSRFERVCDAMIRKIDNDITKIHRIL